MSSTLTEWEYQLLTDPTLLPSKFQIGKKIDQWLGALHRELKAQIAQAEALPEEVKKISGKISRGENYHNQAYRVLDCPRLFRKDAMFAYRCIVLWGHPIGFHLMLAGRYKETYQDRIMENRSLLGSNCYLVAQESPWIWEADAKGLKLCRECSEQDWQDHLDTYQFLKLSYFHPLSEYEQLAKTGLHHWNTFLSVLGLNA